MGSASVQVMEAADQDLDAEDVGKLTEADKAHIGRVGPSFQQVIFVSVLFIFKQTVKHNFKTTHQHLYMFTEITLHNK